MEPTPDILYFTFIDKKVSAKHVIGILKLQGVHVDNDEVASILTN